MKHIQQMINNLKKFFKSFSHAVSGIAFTIKTQRNFRFHIMAMLWVILLSLFYDLSKTEYAVLILTFSSVIALEAVNTAIEKAVDLCTLEQHNLAKVAKDTAAGAVLISAVFAVGVAFCLFWDKTVFAEIAVYFGNNPIALIIVGIMAVISFIFIF